jgi:hypothetical protein
VSVFQIQQWKRHSMRRAVETDDEETAFYLLEDWDDGDCAMSLLRREEDGEIQEYGWHYATDDVSKGWGPADRSDWADLVGREVEAE